MSYLIQHEDVMEAIRLVLPAIKVAMKKGVVKRSHLHIVALKPGVRYDPQYQSDRYILCEYSMGKEAWENEYDKIARGKAAVTLRTGLPSLYVIQRAPHLLDFGDAKYGGSVNLDGVIVACSGVQSHFDEMFSMWIAAAIKGIAIEKMQAVVLKDEENDFLK